MGEMAMNEEIMRLIVRKAKADSQPAEIKSQYADHYNLIVSKIVEYAIDHQLPNWDYEINSEILSITLKDMAQKYENKKPYIEWMCQRLIPEVDESFRVRDQARFYQCIQVASKQIGNV